jgi:hypothetical protein
MDLPRKATASLIEMPIRKLLMEQKTTLIGEYLPIGTTGDSRDHTSRLQRQPEYLSCPRIFHGSSTWHSLEVPCS